MRKVVEQICTLKYPFLLLLAAAIWGLGTVFIKDIVSDIPPFWFAGIRFFCAGIVMCVLFAPKIIATARTGTLARHMRTSAILGAPMILGYMANALGLVGTTAAKSSFLTGLYCVIVPFVTWILTRRRPSGFNICAAIMCVTGIALVSLVGQTDTISMGWGDAVTLICAVFLAIQLAATSQLAAGHDMSVITGLQFLFGGAFALVIGAALEPAPDIALLVSPAMLPSIAYVVLGSTCAALLLQNVGLAKVPAASGSLLLSFESVFGVLFSVLLLGELLTLPMISGFALIFAAVVVSEWLPTSSFGHRLQARFKNINAAQSAANTTPADASFAESTRTQSYLRRDLGLTSGTRQAQSLIALRNTARQNGALFAGYNGRTTSATS